MNKEELKIKAVQVAEITNNYELEVEDYSEKKGKGRAFFSWRNNKVYDCISIELDDKGSLISISREMINRLDHRVKMEEEQLKEIALGFVKDHYSEVIHLFELNEIIKESDDLIRFIYIQKELHIALPYSGFYVDVTHKGDIVKFHYYGIAENIIKPSETINKKNAKEIYLNNLKMNLLISNLNSDKYEEGDHLPHLVYEPQFKIFRLPADPRISVVNQEYDENLNGSNLDRVSLPIPIEREMCIEDLIGLDSSAFKKIREVDLGSTLGTVWRMEEDTPVVSGRDISSFFQKRNENTIKIIKDKQTGKIKNIFSFMNKKGSLKLNKENCYEIALQFLFKLYPQANEYFDFLPTKNETSKHGFMFHFRMTHDGIPIRYGNVEVSVNLSTGTVDHYMGPELDPEQLISINKVPTITRLQAKEIVKSEFDVELQWEREIEDGEHYYRLVYKPVFPSLSGELAFIESQSGECILKR
ncbi:YcdB/YcdC domain-containing protein [Chengkuizengella sp. SCS-71B]|uniref:YcdB/YcdC domain-containing protein n=1 Tax=Chengkuizengella sp. SCS-71B TaxID=3115290 RepID=UPI0032C23B15